MTDFYPARLPDREQRHRLAVLREAARKAYVAACIAEDRGDLAAALRAHRRVEMADQMIADVYTAARSNGPNVELPPAVVAAMPDPEHLGR